MLPNRSRFEREAAALADVIGPWITGGIHHVGSTAVPGLAGSAAFALFAASVSLAFSVVLAVLASLVERFASVLEILQR